MLTRYTRTTISLISAVIILLVFAQRHLYAQELKSHPVLDKINFDISTISSEGLSGSPDGLRSIHYEFCIPATDASLAAVRSIDSNIVHYPNSPGRIGCQSDQYLCIGNTHTPDWREILWSIASLEFVERIDPFYGE